MPTLGITRCLEKTLHAIIPISGGAAQWIKAQVGKRKESALGSVTELSNVLLGP